MTQQAGDQLVNGGRRWRFKNSISSRRKLLEDGDKLRFEWKDATHLKLTAFFPNGTTHILGAPLTLAPDGNGNFLVTAYGRKMKFFVSAGSAAYTADFETGPNNNPDEGGDTDPD